MDWLLITVSTLIAVFTPFLLILILSYFRKKRKQQIRTPVLLLSYAMPKNEQDKYNEDDLLTQKDNSPASKQTVSVLLCDGQQLMSKDSIIINDRIVEESGYRVL